MSPVRRFALAPPAAALLPLPEVLRITGYGRSAVYEAMRAGLVPQPVKVGRASRWPEDEVQAVRAAILRGDDVGARRALVRQLVTRRGAARLAIVRLDGQPSAINVMPSNGTLAPATVVK